MSPMLLGFAVGIGICFASLWGALMAQWLYRRWQDHRLQRVWRDVERTPVFRPATPPQPTPKEPSVLWGYLLVCILSIYIGLAIAWLLALKDGSP